MDNKTPIDNLKGIGAKSAELFHKLGIFNCADLLNYYPRAYDSYERICDIKSASVGERNAILATVKSTPKIQRYNNKSIVSFFVTDSENVFEVKFFNAPYMLKSVKVGDRKVFRGILRAIKDRLLMDQPKMYAIDEYSKLEGTIAPVYVLTKDLSNDRLSKCVRQVIDGLPLPDDYLTSEELKEYSLSNYRTALKNIHFPADFEAQYYARRRIVFEEFLSFVRMAKEGAKENVNLPNGFKMIEVADCKRLQESLPYSLTNAQNRAVNDIFNDMGGDYLMNRLVQGDVGSGKTIVAVMALLMCAANGYQGAMMAPTEVLARQHFENIKALTDKYNLCFKPVLLTGKMSAKDKREALASIANCEANVVLGTHAIIQKGVEFKNLALVITDEQHRFGVKQRETFKNKGSEPHLLVMSATPIPRTLAMIVFAGLSVSIIDELPKNRIPVQNCVVNSSYRRKSYEKIKEELDAGHQAYIICPMVYDNDEYDPNLKSVEQHTKDIKEYFGDAYRVASLNGKMKPDEKTRIMENFKNKNIDILVSTTVIEVGIDVPNATIIMIENADRFGLSQLHQLRGRVGRGSDASYCILMSDTKNEETLKRLKILNSTNDGFKIANEDMKLRGPGELNGVRQSGELQFSIGDIVEDGDLMLLAGSFYEKAADRLHDIKGNLIDFRTI
ncbi:MAG: ATP-dependent DNA helicase RecG [Lachnospiraceae bacterium]|nr:ATP-dependent DNA helicase RecG [Lachnospiraceae bacterium]